MLDKPVLTTIEEERFVEETISGKRVVRRVVKPKDVPEEETVPVLREDGSPYLVIATEKNTEEHDPRRRALGHQPMTMSVPVYRDVPTEHVTRAAQNNVFSRTHMGFSAQGVKQALVASGLDEDDNERRSIWAMLIYDPEADLYGLRYEQLIPVLVSGWQTLDERLRNLERRLGE